MTKDKFETFAAAPVRLAELMSWVRPPLLRGPLYKVVWALIRYPVALWYGVPLRMVDTPHASPWMSDDEPDIFEPDGSIRF